MFPQSILKRFPPSLYDSSAVFLLVNHRLIFKCYQISSKLRRELLCYTRDTCTFLLSHVVDISRSERRRNETFQTFRHTKRAFLPRHKETMILSRHAMCSATKSLERRAWFTRTINLKETRLNASPDGTNSDTRADVHTRPLNKLVASRRNIPLGAGKRERVRVRRSWRWRRVYELCKTKSAREKWFSSGSQLSASNRKEPRWYRSICPNTN